jgi:hypothetical protein
MNRRSVRRLPAQNHQLSGHCRRRLLRPGPGLPEPFAPVPAPEPRLLCSDLVTLRLHSPGFAPRDIGAILEEISPRSACLQFEEPIPVDTSVRFLLTESAEGGELTGTVVQCLHQPDLGFFGEVRFAPGCTWSPRYYRPLHLFDPTERMAASATAGG